MSLGHSEEPARLQSLSAGDLDDDSKLGATFDAGRVANGQQQQQRQEDVRKDGGVEGVAVGPAGLPTTRGAAVVGLATAADPPPPPPGGGRQKAPAPPKPLSARRLSGCCTEAAGSPAGSGRILKSGSAPRLHPAAAATEAAAARSSSGRSRRSSLAAATTPAVPASRSTASLASVTMT